MYCQARRFIADKKVFVLPKHIDVSLFGLELCVGFWHVQFQPLSSPKPDTGECRVKAIQAAASFTDGLLQGRSREFRCKSAEKMIQPLADLLCGRDMAQYPHGKGSTGVLRVRNLSTKVMGR